MSLIMAENVQKVYRTGETEVRALKGVSLVIESGSFVSIVGPSGSGKTTLLNLIGCLDKVSEGKLMVAGTEVAALDRGQGAIFCGEKLGFIFQDFNLIPVLTVYENIEYPLLMVQDVPARQRAERVLSLLREVGMAEQKNKRPDQISGGQKQRVAVARALVTSPALVLADEPTANLADESFTLSPEILYAPLTDLELRLKGSWLHGGALIKRIRGETERLAARVAAAVLPVSDPMSIRGEGIQGDLRRETGDYRHGDQKWSRKQHRVAQ